MDRVLNFFTPLIAIGHSVANANEPTLLHLADYLGFFFVFYSCCVIKPELGISFSFPGLAFESSGADGVYVRTPCARMAAITCSGPARVVFFRNGGGSSFAGGFNVRAQQWRQSEKKREDKENSADDQNWQPDHKDG